MFPFSAKLLSNHSASIATIIANCGAVAGGTIAGYVSMHLASDLFLPLLTAINIGVTVSWQTIDHHRVLSLDVSIAPFGSSWARFLMFLVLGFRACFIPLWIIPEKFGPLAAGAFFVQMWA
jgi:SHS family lactate transporter-like MFS transporter